MSNQQDDSPSEERYKLVPVGLSLDQILGIYNSNVKDETRKKAQSFLRKNRKAILEMLTLHKTDNY